MNGAVSATARVLLALGLAVTVVGCARSLRDMRESAPDEVVQVPSADYRVLAGCVVEALQGSKRSVLTAELGNLAYETVTRPDQRRATITGKTETGLAIVDVVFRQREDAVGVEVRWVTAGFERLRKELRALIVQCGATAKRAR